MSCIFGCCPPAWGYVDQPPLTPLLVHAAIALFGDSVVALRVVATVCAVVSIPILCLITREVGGSRSAQALTAWGMAGASLTLIFGHVFLTASVDLVVWPAALLFTIRAVLRHDGRWWLAAGVVIGASTFNKLLVVVLMFGIAAGLAVFGPRRWFTSGWLWAGVGLTGLLAVPNVVYQAVHGWPQLAVGAALSANNADEVRVMMWPMLVLLVGPVLAVCWVSAIVWLFRRPEWRPLRFLTAVLCTLIIFVAAGGSQFYYTAGVLAALVAIGSVPVSHWADMVVRRRVLTIGVIVNSLACMLTVTPILPVGVFAASGLAVVNSQAADQIGWKRYADQIGNAAADTDADVVITSNYGEAGALSRYGSGRVPVISGHNSLWELGRPPTDARSVVFVGEQAQHAHEWFDSCRLISRLDNGVGVENEEQGQPVFSCTGPVEPWNRLWHRFHHFD